MNCSKDDIVYQVNSTKVSFVNTTHVISQENESVIIPLKLDPKAISSGYITVELSGNANYGSDYTTLPEAVNNKIIINLPAAEQYASFTVYRASPLTVEKAINLKLINPTVNFTTGSLITSEVKLNPIINNANKLNFDVLSGTISEGNSEGMVISLNTTGPVTNTSGAKLKLIIPQGIIYGTHFYTIPAAVLNEIPLEFNQNSQTTSFKILPINDYINLGDYVIKFEIIEINGGLVIGEYNQFTATILENDQTSGIINSIAELKSKFNDYQGDWYLQTEYLIEGVITSNGNTPDDKSVYIQDGTSGILIRFNTATFFNMGDKVRLNLVNGTGTFFNGQKGIDNVSLNGYAKYVENVYVAPETITIGQLHSGDYEGRKVKIDNVYFTYANGVFKFLGNNFIRSQYGDAIVKTYPKSEFSDYPLPFGQLSIIGIVGGYGHIMPQKYTHDIIVY